MKILHTSDWHLGQVLYGYERGEEQSDMLRQITEAVASEQPDALVVSGDIFHTGNPSSAAVEMYNAAILSIHDACPAMQIVITAGNHDSAAKLVVNNALWSHFNVHTIGQVARTKDERRAPDYDSHIIEIHSKDNSLIGYIAAIPHCYESNYPTEVQGLQRKERADAYYKGLSEYIGTINPGGLPTVLMAHMAVSECDMAGHDVIGGMESRDADTLGNAYSYIALGHIHTPQNINSRTRYCGSPIPVNFGEKFGHSVSIVTIEKDKEPEIRTIPIRNLIPLEDFPTPLPDADATETDLEENLRPLPFKEVLGKIRSLDPDIHSYLRIIVKVDDSLSPLANTQIAEALKGKKARFCLIKPFIYRHDRATAESSRKVILSANDLKEKDPLEIAGLYFAMRGLEMTDAKAEMIREAISKAEELNRK